MAGSQQDATPAAVHGTRGKAWLEAFETVTAEMRGSGDTSEELLKRMKLIDERLGVLFGDRPAKAASDTTTSGGTPKRKKAKRYRVVG